MFRRSLWTTGSFQCRKIRFFRFVLVFPRISTIRTDAKYVVLYIFRKHTKWAFRKYILVLCSDVLTGLQGGFNVKKNDFSDFFCYFDGSPLFARTQNMSCYTFLESTRKGLSEYIYMSYGQTYFLGSRGVSMSKNTIFTIFFLICTDFDARGGHVTKKKLS